MAIDNSFSYNLRIILAYKDILRNHCSPITRKYINNFRQSQLKAARKLQNKECLSVAFFLTIPGMWKHDALFKAMLRDPHFHPFVVIYPYSAYKGYEKDELLKTLERTRLFIEQKGYEYVIPYDEKTKTWRDVKHTHHPDIVFFTTPYKDVSPQYFIYHFKDTLTCYIPYAFTSLDFYKANYDLIFHNLVGLFFQETEIHSNLAKKYGRNGGVNAVVTGYPATEIYLDENYQPISPWKPQSVEKKRLIYAPHHSIDTDHNSTFLKYCDDLLSLAEKYKDNIQLAFKPHQTLKLKLQKIWGTKKTEKYYQLWETMENTQLVNDGYEDLFLTSDAMIHDSGSFTTEYLFTKKPVMYLCSNSNMTNKFNEFGLNSFNQHYHGHDIADIEYFLNEVIIKGNDPIKTRREQFFECYLKPKDGLLPSQKIIQVIDNFIKEYDGEPII